MIEVRPIQLENYTVLGTVVKLPKTSLISISTEQGYVMCGALDVGLLRDALADRGIIAARAVGVRTLDDLFNGVVESCTQKAEEIGIHEGMDIREALLLMKQYELGSN